MNTSTSLSLKQALEFLPHGQEIQIVDRVLELTQENIACLSKNPCPLAFCLSTTAGVDSTYEISYLSFVEFVAQAAALGRIMSLSHGPDSNIRKGAVLRARGFASPAQTIAREQSLLIRASWSQSLGGAFEVEGSVCDPENPNNEFSSGRLTMLEFE